MRSLLRQLIAADWAAARQWGRPRFVRRRVLEGVVLGVALAAWTMYDEGYTWHSALSLHGLALAYYFASVAALIAYAEARIEWRRKERRHNTMRDAL